MSVKATGMMNICIYCLIDANERINIMWTGERVRTDAFSFFRITLLGRCQSLYAAAENA